MSLRHFEDLFEELDENERKFREAVVHLRTLHANRAISQREILTDEVIAQLALIRQLFYDQQHTLSLLSRPATE
jgi:hypothetical protein